MFMPQAPIEALESDGCAGSSFDFLHDVLSRPRIECRRTDVQGEPANKRRCGKYQGTEEQKDPAPIEKPQCCSFCEWLPTRSLSRGSSFLERHYFGSNPLPVRVAEWDSRCALWPPVRKRCCNSCEYLHPKGE